MWWCGGCCEGEREGGGGEGMLCLNALACTAAGPAPHALQIRLQHLPILSDIQLSSLGINYLFALYFESKNKLFGI